MTPAPPLTVVPGGMGAPPPACPDAPPSLTLVSDAGEQAGGGVTRRGVARRHRWSWDDLIAALLLLSCGVACLRCLIAMARP